MINENFQRFYGFYRAKVTESKDPQKYGRVKLWVPDIMPKVSRYDPTVHLWARPANNPIGGRNNKEENTNYYTGSSYIPKIGSWVWCFFENGNPNRPYYWGALDIENSPVIAENQFGGKYEDKWTVLKSHDGRCMVFSDDPDDERVEITGKKRQMNNPPSGDTVSVFTILDNQTTILLDEREGNEKLLIKTYKGDYINFDIETRKLHIYTYDDIHMKSDKSIYMQAAEDIHMSAGKTVYVKASADINEYAGGMVNIDGVDTFIQSQRAIPATDADPLGLRAQVFSECAIIVALAGGVSDMGGIGDDIIANTEEMAAAGSGLASHMQTVNDYITGEIQSFNDLNAQRLRDQVVDTSTMINGVKTTVASSVNDSINTVSDSYSNLSNSVSNANDAIDNIHRSFDQRNPNTTAVYEEINSARTQLDNLSSIIEQAHSGTGSVTDLYERINNISLDPAAMADHIDQYANIQSSLNSFENTADDLLSSFSSDLADYESRLPDLADSVGDWMTASDMESLKLVSKKTLDQLSEGPFDKKKAEIDSSILQEKMIWSFDNWSLKEMQMNTQIKDAYDQLGLTYANTNVNALQDDMTVAFEPRDIVVSDLNDINTNLTGMSDMADIGTEIANYSNDANNAASDINFDNLTDTVIDLQDHARDDRENIIADSLGELANSLGEINNIVYNITGQSSDLLAYSSDLSSEVSDITTITQADDNLDETMRRLQQSGNDLDEAMAEYQERQAAIAEAEARRANLAATQAEFKDKQAGIVWSSAYRERVYSQAQSLKSDPLYQERDAQLSAEIANA